MASPVQDAAAAALQSIAGQLIAAGGADKRISRRDARQFAASLSGEEADLAKKLFRFIDDRDDAPGAVVTEKDVEASVAYIEKYLIREYDLDGFDQNNSSYFSYPRPARLAFELVSILKRIGEKNAVLQGADIAAELARLSNNLVFDYLGSEAAIEIKPFFKEANLNDLTVENFYQVMGLDRTNPDEQIDRFFRLDTDADFWPAFIGGNAYVFVDGQPANLSQQATELKAFMEARLGQLTGIVQGLDNVSSSSEHPTYIVGITSDGDLAGFETVVIWT